MIVTDDMSRMSKVCDLEMPDDTLTRYVREHVRHKIKRHVEARAGTAQSNVFFHCYRSSVFAPSFPFLFMFFVLFVLCCHASGAARCCLLFHPFPCAGGGGCGRCRQCHRPGACDSLLPGRGREAFDRPRQRCESFDACEPWQFVLTSRGQGLVTTHYS